jgi:hypothetical protein
MTKAPEKPEDLGDDLLEGAAAIAEYLFGSRKFRRKVYYLAQHSRLPVFRLSSVLCARKSVLASYIRTQEIQPIKLLRLQAQIAELTGTVEQLERAGLDTTGARDLITKRRVELKNMKG